MTAKNWKLKHKIIFHMMVVGFLAAILLTLLYIKTQKNIIYQMSHQKAELVAAIIENSIYSAMKEANLEKVQSTIEGISLSKDIKAVRILSSKGKVLRSSIKEEIGSQAKNTTLHEINNFLLKPEKDPAISVELQATLQGFHAIRNQPECHSCHDPEEKINGILEVHIDYSGAAFLLKKSQLQGVLIALAALSVLTVVIFRLFNNLINKPISHLKEKMKEVEAGNLDISLQPTKNDEIGSLAQNFQNMVKKLKEANQKIEELFKKQMEKAEHLASIGELSAGLAHDIRNPIAGMKGALEIISQATDPSDPKKEIFTEILVQIEKINSIIQDLLRFAKPKELSMSLVSPNDCVQTALKLAHPQLNGKDIQLTFKKMKTEKLAYLDADKIQELLLNLLLNSIAAIKDKGEIKVEIRETNPNNLKIIVSDNGAGIKEEHLSQIFNPFFTTKKSGTGLGLSICKKIIEAHEGTVTVKSKVNEGTTFIIRLPVLTSAK